MEICFRQAGPDDQVVVLEILNEAAEWLRLRGIEQWPAHFNTADWRSNRIGKYIDSGESWLVLVDGEPAATFNLTDQADPDYAAGWPDGTKNALYIYRMAVRRKWAGYDLGTFILDWAEARAACEDKAWLRLDCHRRNRTLQEFYERRGFARVNTLITTIDDRGTPYTRGSGALYQRPTANAASTGR